MLHFFIKFYTFFNSFIVKQILLFYEKENLLGSPCRSDIDRL